MLGLLLILTGRKRVSFGDCIICVADAELAEVVRDRVRRVALAFWLLCHKRLHSLDSNISLL